MKLKIKLMCLSALILVGSVVIWIAFADASNWHVPAGYATPSVTFNDILYFTTVSTFTVGYGDFSPRNPVFKNFVILIVVGSYAIMSW